MKPVAAQTQDPLLLKHLKGESIGRLPVWMMRQAGRYLPSYRAIRKDHSFWEMVTTPALAAEVSLLPLQTLAVDGVIFFSDILTLPYSLKIPIEMKESVGPVLATPFRQAKDFEVFSSFEAPQHTPYVGEALRKIRGQIKPEMALLGFAGAPWTVASYLIEGGGSKHFQHIKTWMYRDPVGLTAALEKLSDATFEYLKFQSSSGAHMVQVFDTWLAEMPRAYFLQHYQPVLHKLFGRLRQERIPVIYFSKNAHHLLRDFVEFSVDVVSLDSLVSLTEANLRLGAKFSLQGNLDPILLLGEEPVVRRETRRLVEEARRLPRPAILNLGHGLLPQTPVQNVQAFVEEARSLWI